MSEPGSALAATLDKVTKTRDTARETAIALAAERERKVNEAAGVSTSALTPAVSLTYNESENP